jgi:hypothetical protein
MPDSLVVGIVLEAKHYFNALACANKNICDDSNLIQFSMSVGHSFAGDENGYAVSGAVRSEGLRGRKLSQKCRSCGPAVGANCAHAFAAVFARG